MILHGSRLGRLEPREVGRTYAWLVTHDPEAIFTNRLFQLQDLEAGAKLGTWPEGIRFTNIHTDKVKVYEAGELHDERDD